MTLNQLSVINISLYIVSDRNARYARVSLISPRYPISDMKNPDPIWSRYPIFRTLFAGVKFLSWLVLSGLLSKWNLVIISFTRIRSLWKMVDAFVCWSDWKQKSILDLLGNDLAKNISLIEIQLACILGLFGTEFVTEGQLISLFLFGSSNVLIGGLIIELCSFNWFCFYFFWVFFPPRPLGILS